MVFHDEPGMISTSRATLDIAPKQVTMFANGFVDWEGDTVPNPRSRKRRNCARLDLRWLASFSVFMEPLSGSALPSRHWDLQDAHSAPKAL
jgi:hypothetical protein